LTLGLAGGTLAAVATLPTSASAASPVALDAPENGTAPLIAYDSSTQTTYVAWSDPVQPGVDLCVLPAGATGCEGGAPVLLEDSKYPGYSVGNHPGLGGLVVLPNGEAVVIGTPVSTGSIAWASPAGGAAFLSGEQGLQNGGKFISPVSLFYTFGNAVALNSKDVGLLDDYGDFFSDSPLTAESPKIGAPTPNSNQTTPEGQFPRKALETNGPEIAAEPAPAPAPAGTDIVVGVGDNFGGPPAALPGCLNKEGTGYGVSVGTVDGTSNAAGTLNAKGLPGYGVLACSAEAPVLAQGDQDGIGLVEEEGEGIDGAGESITLDYRPFDATSIGGTFGAPVQLADVTHESLGGVINLDLSEDSGTGVYATWEDFQGLVLDYSSNGGASWEPPVVVPEPTGGPQGNPVIVGIGNGNAEIAYVDNPGTGPQVFLQAVNYQELAAAAHHTEPPPPTSTPAADTLTTTQTGGTAAGASITIPAGTIGETDRASLSGAKAAIATGTVTYGLYSSSSCASATKVFSGGTTAVTSGVAAPSAPVSAALAPGKYYWQATYSGDANNLASTSACGSEVLTVGPAAAIEGKGTSTGTTVTITITCASTPCTVTLTITIDPPAASTARKKKAHAKTITLATGKFTIKTMGPHKLTVRLTKAGKRLLARDHGRLSAKVLVSEKTAGGVQLTTRTVKFVPAKPKHKK